MGQLYLYLLKPRPLSMEKLQTLLGRWVMKTTDQRSPGKPEHHPKQYEINFLSYRKFLTSDPTSKEKQIQVRIMDSGIFWEGMLKGKARSGGSRRNPKYIMYPLRSPNLIGALLRELAEQFMEDDVDDALAAFYGAFDAIAQTARYAGVTQKQIDNVKKSWGEKVKSKFESDGPPGWWNDRSGPEDRSQPLYARLGYFLVSCLENSSKVPHARIAVWVNAILKAIGEEPVGDRTLRDYIKTNRKKWVEHWRSLFEPRHFC
jgi:hypothetical protein